MSMVVAMISIATNSAFAVSSSGITYQGRILKPDDTPLAGVQTKFRMKILTPGSDSCVMYQEEQQQDLSSSDGNFSLTLNDGNGVRLDTATYDIEQIFANKGTFTFAGSSCPTADVTYAPGADDHRILVVEFKDETMGSWEPMPPQTINYVPMALQAKNIAGFGIGNLVRVQEADGSFLSNVTPLSNANYDALKLLVAGTSGLYERAGRLNNVSMPTMTSGQTLGWNGSAWTSVDPIAGVQAFAKTALPACAGGAYLRNNAGALECTTPAAGTTGTVTEIRTGTGLTGGPINDDGDIALATLNAGGTGFKVTYDVYGRVTAAVALVEADIPQLSTAGKVVGSAITSGTIGGSTSINTTGTINSGAITSTGLVSSSSGSFTALGTQGIQVFKTDNSYSVSVIANPAQGSNYTLTLPANGGTNGQVLTTNGTGGLSWTNAASGSVTSLTGDVTSTGSGAVTTTIANSAVTFAKMQNVPTTSIVGRYSAGSGAPESLTLGTGLALSGAGVLSATVTDTDTFAAVTTACGNGTVPLKAGGVWTCATPTPLATASAIVQRDGTGNFAANVVTMNGAALNNAGSIVNLVNLAGSAYTLTMPVGVGTTGQVLGTSGSGQLTWTTPAAPGTGDFKADGTVPMTGNIRLNGNYLSGDGGSEGVYVDSDGDVGIGTSTPGEKLEVAGVARAYSFKGGSAELSNGANVGLVSVSGGATDPFNYSYFSLASTVDNKAWLINHRNGTTTPSNNNRFDIAHYNGTTYPTMMSILPSGNMGIGTTSPLTKLDVAGTIKVADSGEACVAGVNGAIRFNGGNLQYCVGTTWTTLGAAGAGLTALTGDVTASGGGSQAATIAANAVTTGKILDGTIATADLANSNVTFAKIQDLPTSSLVGRYAATTGVAQSVTIGTGLALNTGTGVLSSTVTDTDTFASTLGACANGTVPLRAGGVWTCGVPTPLNTASALVQRDGSGNFAAGVITANGLALNNGGSVVNVINPSGAAYTLTLPSVVGTNGQVLSTSGSGTLTWASPASGTGDFKADGSVPMTGALVAANGTVSAPGIRFATGATSGLWAPAANTLAVSTSSIERMRINATGQVGINTAPNSMLDVKGEVRISGSTSGFVGFAVPSAAGSTTYTWPSLSIPGNVLSVDGSGNLSWVALPSGSVTSLTGDVTSTGSGAVATTIAANAITTGKITDANVTFAKIQDLPASSLVGRYTASTGVAQSITLGTGLALNTSTGVLSNSVTDTDTFAAVTTACGNGTVPLKAGGVWTCATPTPLATASAIVQRDGTGNFAANVVTMNGAALNNAGSIVNLVNLAGSAYTLTMPVGVGTTGQVLGTSGSGQLTWSTPAVGGLTNFTESIHTAAPNATTPVARLLATNAATDVDVTLSPKGGGALTAQVADSTATGGIKRGISAVDWQMSRVSSSQTAYGTMSVVSGGSRNSAQSYSAVGGGYTNNASGQYATIPGGSNNTASGFYSFAANNTTTAESQSQSTFGQFNMPKGSEDAGNWVTTDPLFVVGNGTAGGASRSNALMILKNGNTGLGTASPSEKFHVRSAGGSRIFMESDTDNNSASDSVGISMKHRALSTARSDIGVGRDIGSNLGMVYSTAVGNVIDNALVLNSVGQSTNGAVQLATENAVRMTVNAAGNVGIGTTSPGASLDVKGEVRISGATSGYVGFASQAAAGSTTYTWPAAPVAGNVLSTDASGNLSWAAAAGGMTALTGDVTASGSGSQATTIANSAVTFAKMQNLPASSLVGRYTASTGVAQSITIGTGLALNTGTGVLSNTVTDTDTFAAQACGNYGMLIRISATWFCVTADTAATNNAIVQRTAAGSFAANIGTFNGVALNNAGSVVTLANPAGSSYTLTVPVGAGTTGQVLTATGGGNTSWTTPASGGAWSIKTAAYTAVAGDRIMADTSGSAFTITLPASATIGDTITILDVSGSFATNNLTIGRNGLNIMSLAEDLTVSDANMSFELIYSNSTYGWRLK